MNATMRRYAVIAAVSLLAVAIANRVDTTRRLING